MEKTERNMKALERINEIFEEYNIPTLEGVVVRGGSDAANVTQYGITCLDSLGTQGGGSHYVEEYAELHSLSGAVKRILVIAHNF